MTATDYRRYTTAELAAMPDTARLEDLQEREWHPDDTYNIRRWILEWGFSDITTTSRLARRKLRRIA